MLLILPMLSVPFLWSLDLRLWLGARSLMELEEALEGELMDMDPVFDLVLACEGNVCSCLFMFISLSREL